MTTTWDRLLAVATLGTRKQALPQEALWPTSELAGSAPLAAKELTLLRAAAATWLYTQAGTRFAADATPATPPPLSRGDRAAPLRSGCMALGAHHQR